MCMLIQSTKLVYKYTKLVYKYTNLVYKCTKEHALVRRVLI